MDIGDLRKPAVTPACVLVYAYHKLALAMLTCKNDEVGIYITDNFYQDNHYLFCPLQFMDTLDTQIAMMLDEVSKTMTPNQDLITMLQEFKKKIESHRYSAKTFQEKGWPTLVHNELENTMYRYRYAFFESGCELEVLQRRIDQIIIH